MHTFTSFAVLGLAAAVSAYTLSPELVSALEARDIDVEEYLFARELITRAPPRRPSGGAPRSPPPSSPPPRSSSSRSSRFDQGISAVHAGANFAGATADVMNAYNGPRRRDLLDDEEFVSASELFVRAPPYRSPPRTNNFDRGLQAAHAGTQFLSATANVVNAYNGPRRRDVEDFDDAELFARSEFDFDLDDYEF